MSPPRRKFGDAATLQERADGIVEAVREADVAAVDVLVLEGVNDAIRGGVYEYIAFATPATAVDSDGGRDVHGGAAALSASDGALAAAGGLASAASTTTGPAVLTALPDPSVAAAVHRLQLTLDLNKPSSRRHVPAAVAAADAGHVAVFEYLVKLGANPFVCGATGLRAIDVALQAAVRSGDVPALRRLVAAGADVDSRTEYDEPTLLLAAAAPHRLDTVRTLLDCGASLTAVNAANETAVHVACVMGRLPVVEHLMLHTRVDLFHRRDGDGALAVDLARLNGHAKVVARLQWRMEEVDRQHMERRLMGAEDAALCRMRKALDGVEEARRQKRAAWRALKIAQVALAAATRAKARAEASSEHAHFLWGQAEKAKLHAVTRYRGLQEERQQALRDAEAARVQRAQDEKKWEAVQRERDTVVERIRVTTLAATKAPSKCPCVAHVCPLM